MKGGEASPSANALARMRELVQEYFVKQMHTTAVFWADKVVSLSGGAMEDVFWLAQGYYFTGQYHRGMFLLGSMDLIDKNLCCRYIAAKCLAACSDWEQALVCIGNDRTVEEVNGKIVEEGFRPLKDIGSAIALLRGTIYESLENRPKAIEAYKLALHRSVYCFEAFDRLTRHQMLAGKDEEKMFNSLPFDEQCGEDAETIKFLYASKMRKYEEGPEPTDTLPAAIRNNPDVVVDQAERLYYHCEFKKCHEITTRILDADPYHHSCLPIHIASLVELKDRNGLFYLAHKLVDSYPERVIPWFAVGSYYFVIGNNESARRYFGKATHLDPHFAPAWLGFGHSFAEEGEHDQAMAAYCSAARLMSGCHLPLLYIGMEHVQTNNIAMATKYFQQARDICDQDPLVFHELGIASYKSGKLKDAAEHLSYALKILKSKDSSNQDTWVPVLTNLGRVHHKLGEYEKSIEYYDEAVTLSPRQASSYAGLGFANQSLRRFEAAIEYYHKALALNPHDTFSTQMLAFALEEALNDDSMFDPIESDL